MELNHLLLEALNLMLIGMLFVGAFLGLLVLLIPLLNKITPDDAPAPVTTATPASTTTDEQPAVVAAIAAAVKQYRKRH